MDHEHPRTHRHPGKMAALVARVRHLAVPHSHDSATRVDSALESSKRGMRALVVSFLVLAGTAAAQLALVAVTGSVALLGDTVHNFADALTAVPIGIAFLLGRRPPSRRYTYGLGRSEDIAGVIVVLVILSSAVLAGYQSVRRLVDPQPVEHLWVLAAAGAVGFAGNELVARYRIRVGKQIGSAALVADGLHARTDGFTSLAVVLGAIGVALGFPLADPLIGLAITVAILFVLRDAARQVLHRLMDAVDPATVDLAERSAADVPGVHRVTDLRIRWIGHTLRAELAITVDDDLTVGDAHHIAHDAERHLLAAIPHLTSATIHIEPSTGGHIAHARATPGRPPP